MAKIIDITDELKFDKKAVIIVKGQCFEVNNDAETYLKIIGNFAVKNEAEAMVDAYELMFSENTRNRIAQMKLSAGDFMKLLSAAIEAIQGEDEEQEMPLFMI